MTDLKFYSLTLVGFMIFLGIVLPKPAPEVISPENRAKIDAYNREEDAYRDARAKCGELVFATNGGSALRGGPSCNKSANDIAILEVKHARWTIARSQKFGGGYDVEAQWIVAHGGR